jgi:hypothetical protein
MHKVAVIAQAERADATLIRHVIANYHRHDKTRTRKRRENTQGKRSHSIDSEV